MAEGHHYVPNAVRRELAPVLSPEADRVFENSVTTNPKGLTHNVGRMKTDPSLTHSRYNAETLETLCKEIERLRRARKLRGGKISGAQATEIVRRIKKDGLGNNYMLRFNTAVLKSLRITALGGIILGSLQQAAKAAKITDMVVKNGHYKNAVTALQNGDWRRANAEIQGGYPSGHNLIDDLIEAHFYKEAMILQGRWQEREKDFVKIEHGQSVPGVPDSF